jgi:hypothetical protein
VNGGFKREIEIEQGKKTYLPEVLHFETYEELKIVQNWVDIVSWDAETFEKLCEVNHFDSDNM